MSGIVWLAYDSHVAIWPASCRTALVNVGSLASTEASASARVCPSYSTSAPIPVINNSGSSAEPKRC